MKRIISSILMLVACAVMALADTSATSVGCTNTIINNATTTDNMGNAVLLDKTSLVSVQVRQQGNTTGTGNVILKFVRSGDGVKYETVVQDALKFTNALNGSTEVIGYHQIPLDTISAARYIKLSSVVNADASNAATNFNVQIIKKTVKPSP